MNSWLARPHDWPCHPSRFPHIFAPGWAPWTGQNYASMFEITLEFAALFSSTGGHFFEIFFSTSPSPTSPKPFYEKSLSPYNGNRCLPSHAASRVRHGLGRLESEAPALNGWHGSFYQEFLQRMQEIFASLMFRAKSPLFLFIGLGNNMALLLIGVPSKSTSFAGSKKSGVYCDVRP